MADSIEIFGIPINSLSYREVLEHIEKIISDNRKSYIVTVNPEMVLRAYKDKNFLGVLKSANIRTPDGIGIIWASDYLAAPKSKNKIQNYIRLFGSLASILLFPGKIRNFLKERITGADLLPKIIDESQKKGWRIFLLGASEGVAEEVIKKFSIIYPKAVFAGYYSGTPNEKDEKAICEIINKTAPDIIFVAYGSPSQELWIHRNLSKLNSVKIAIGVGGAFDFYAGKLKRAPRWMRNTGLEWLWRLILQPKRIKRIWNATVVFIYMVVKDKMKR
jgi:N-acetylglucosaminyldiphosphoundecaprenol N-acetyl-beta-D-mannosaminyltransferase